VGSTIHELLSGVGGHARVLTGSNRLTVSLRLPRGQVADHNEAAGVQAA